MKTTKRTQSGRSMIEMVGVLAVMGLITAGAFVLISTGMQSQKRSRVADEVSAIVTEMQSVDLAQLETESEQGVKTIADLKLPQSSGFGDYTVWGNGGVGMFYVGIIGIADKDCEALAMREWANASSDATCDKNKKLLTIPYTKMSN